MASLLNKNRPPVFCPGCSHEQIVRSLDKAFQNLDLEGNRIVIVTDIGCSGFFDTFFNTHAMHGLHGRALTYATGIKMARPDLNVIVTMGDGGLGIGGAHLLSACRRNLDLTLLILNNFNFGMTGGQFSATTPPEARLSSGFLNQLDRPMDACQVAASAGAAYVKRCSAYQKGLPEEIGEAIRYNGFSVMDIWGICPGRYTKRNKLTPALIEKGLSRLPSTEGEIPMNRREEYSQNYRTLSAGLASPPPPVKIDHVLEPPESVRNEVVFLGSAGQRIVTAGELLCLAGLTAGFRVTQKNEYSTFVLKGPSVSEVILSTGPIDFTGIEKPAVVAALSEEGIKRRPGLLENLDAHSLIVAPDNISLPPSQAAVQRVNFKANGIKPSDWALASLAVLAKRPRVINLDMLKAGLNTKFSGEVLTAALDVVERA